MARPFRSMLTSMITPLRTRKRHPPNQARWSLDMSKFLNLPIEIRIQIYEYLFTDSEIFFTEIRVGRKDRKYAYHTSESRPWSILLTCKFCYHEARTLFVEMTTFVLWSTFDNYKLGNHMLQFVKTLSNFSRLHLLKVRTMSTYSEADIELSSIKRSKADMSLEEGLDCVAKLASLQRWILEKDLSVDWPPERRWLRDYDSSGMVNADDAKEIIGDLRFDRYWFQEIMDRSLKDYRSRYGYLHRIDFLCEVRMRGHPHRPASIATHSRHTNPFTLVASLLYD